MFCLHHEAWQTLGPWPGIEPVPPVWSALSTNVKSALIEKL